MKNYLIIGGGISGVTLAHQIENNGMTFDLVDNNPKFNSSKVAAGFWNPIVFKRLTMSYNAHILLPELLRFYENVESKLVKSFVHHLSQLKIFNSKEERHRFIDKAIVSEVSQYLDESPIENIEGIFAPFGLGVVLQTGYIDTNKYLASSISHFQSIDSYIELVVEHYEINYFENHIEFHGKMYEKVVFCEGYKATSNPLFTNLKLKPTKGEVLIIRAKDITQEYAFAKSAGLIPIGDSKFIVGSTYDWEDRSENPTELAKKKLLYNLKEYLKADIEVIDHQAGIRPSSFDRRPILGVSEVQSSAYILNGFGTKGVMYAPYYSTMLLDFIENSIAIDDDVNYKRCSETR